MKWRVTPQADRDIKRLSPQHRAMFRASIPEFSAGCDRYLQTGVASWHPSLRVTSMVNRDEWEMTWNFQRPAGRATFVFVEIDGEVWVEWRRVGLHEVCD